jgi:hypothetical protein
MTEESYLDTRAMQDQIDHRLNALLEDLTGMIGGIPKVQRQRVQFSTCLPARRHPMVKHVHEGVVMAVTKLASA